MLIYAFRLSILPLTKLNIHNQCLNIDLVSPEYSTDVWLKCHRPPDYKVRSGDAMRSSFIISRPGNVSCGVLIYRLKRRQLHEYIEINEYTSNAVHLLVVWSVSESNELYVDVLLVEHDKRFEWNKDDLKDFYRENFDQFRLSPDSATETWSLDDHTALMITSEIMNENRVLDITVSEVKRDDAARTPAHMKPRRYVALETTIIITILIHAISLALQLSECVTIHNQCSNIELVSPVYFGSGIVCPKLSNQQIDISTTMRACFEINAIQDEFEGALLYKLQIYSDDQYHMDASTTETNEATHIQMLVAWKVNDVKSFVYIALVEHAKAFTWNEDELRRLYNKNYHLLREYDDMISNMWLIDDDMTLKTSLKLVGQKGNFGLSISISEEEKDNYAIRPIWINTKR
jgi:hypothetical protein